MSVTIVLLGALAFFLLLVAIGVWINLAFFIRLKRQRPEVWQSLGEPMPGWNYDGWRFDNVKHFLREGEHRTLKDRRLAALGDRLLRYERVLLAYIIIAALAVGYVVYNARG